MENYILVSQGTLSHWKAEVRDVPQRTTPHKILSNNFDHSIKVFFIEFTAEINLQRTFFFKKLNTSREFIELPCMQESRVPIHSAQLEFYVQFWTLCFKKDKLFQRLEDREATSIRDLKNLIYK